ncbi:MAG: aldo/keto reductase, partial [Pseudomonadota bacterium]
MTHDYLCYQQRTTAHDCRPAQFALAWVLSRGERAMTIPGTTKLENLKTNLGAYTIQLTEEARDLLDLLAERVSGQHYDERGLSTINGYLNSSTSANR